MGYGKWIFWGLFWILLVGFLHYTLPRHDVVRITDTYELRVSPGMNTIFWSNAEADSSETSGRRDVLFIQTLKPNGRPRVFRNEDTALGWPPYFKFDAANLQARAADLISPRGAEIEQWAVVRGYGWRNELITIFPNAVSIRPAEGPDESVFPWFNIIVLTLLAVVLWAIRVRWKRFWEVRRKYTEDEWYEKPD